VLFLQDLFVSEVARGEGAGRLLLRAVYGLADQLRCAQVFWFVDETDRRLQAFYDAEGLRTPFLRYMRGEWPW
jgi:GNAT superfamily N-acetyltransferase